MDKEKLFKEKYATITIVFCLLIGFIPAAFVQNVELRMYTWAMFFVSCSGIFAYELYLNPKNKKILVMFVLTGILAAYTHYYAALTEGFIYLFLIINLIAKYKALKESLIIINLTIAFYLPWLPIFVNQFIVVKDYWWLNVFNWNSIVNIIRYPFNSMFTNTFLIITIVILIGMVVYLFKNKKDKEIWFALLCILSFALMVATGCTVSLLLRPVFTSRYTYTAIGLLFLGMSITVTKIDNGRLLKNLLIGVIILNFPFSYNLNYIREYKTGTEEFKRFAKNIREDITITTESNDIYHTLPYYLPNNELKWKYINGNTRGYVFSDETIEEMRELIPNATVEKLFSGDINGTMRFNVYYME